MSRARATGLLGAKNRQFWRLAGAVVLGYGVFRAFIAVAMAPYYGVQSETSHFITPFGTGSQAQPALPTSLCEECERTGHVPFYPPGSTAFQMLCEAAAGENPVYAEWVKGEQMKFLRLIARRETTRGNPRLVNGIRCKGIWQQHPVHGVASDCPVRQTEWAFGYIRRRYGSPERAWAHHRRRNWY